jgi:hypothetical protein
MKKTLFILQSISAVLSTFFLFCAGKMFAEDYALSQDNVFIDLIVVLSIIGVVFVFLSLWLHFIRQKKYGVIYKNPLISGICFLALMLLPIIWIVWIIGGLFFDQLSRCIPLVYGQDELDTLSYHLIAAGIMLFIQLIYYLTFYFTEKYLSRSVSRLTIKSQDQ